MAARRAVREAALTMTTSRLPTAFGEQLRYWRRRSGHSELALAAEAGTTPRHVSFLETGRSRPGSDIVLRLAQVLDVPLRERNRLLVAAGLPPAFGEQHLDVPELAPYSQADLDKIAAELNGRPRKTLEFMTPSEKFTEAVAITH
jgi:transcriptional regulator with XRE-family HTH domain